jgi:hypothetical protein
MQGKRKANPEEEEKGMRDRGKEREIKRNKSDGEKEKLSKK